MMQRAADRIYPLLHFCFRVFRGNMQHANPLQPTVSPIFSDWAGRQRRLGLQAMEDLDELEKERTLLQAVHQPYRKNLILLPTVSGTHM